MTEDGIGVALRRREDRRFLTGRGRYVHDIVRPQQLHAVFLRSPHAHAEIVTMGTAEALASLDPRSRRIVEARWLVEKDAATLHDLAAEFNVSAERIRQIEAKALSKMKGVLGPE